MLSIQAQLALALARAGMPLRARSILEPLLEHHPTSENYGLMGRVYKGMAVESRDPLQTIEYWKQSRSSYESGYALDGNPYCGINAASISVILEDQKKAEAIAKELTSTCGDDYWSLATAAEAHLILGNQPESRDLYERAVEVAQGKWADIASMRRQCRLICQKLMEKPDLLDHCFGPGTIVFFSGHLLDSEDRVEPRFPGQRVEEVKARFRQYLDSRNIRFAYSSAAAGGDLLFLETALELNAEVHVILPFGVAAFRDASVRPYGESWLHRFDRVLEQAKSLTVLGEDVADLHTSAFDFANRMLAARSSAQGKLLDMPVQGLALWNRRQGDGGGGTADSVHYWSRARLPVYVIHPLDASKDGDHEAQFSPPERAFPVIHSANPDGVTTVLGHICYLSIDGYGNLREREYPAFFRMMGAVAELLVEQNWYPARYGFGNQYVFVWESLRDAAVASVAMMELLERERDAQGCKLEFRMLMNSAPLQLMVNPLLNQYTHEGVSIARLGRISSRLSPGSVFATEYFADLLALERVREVSAVYRGNTGMSEQDGRQRVYQLSC